MAASPEVFARGSGVVSTLRMLPRLGPSIPVALLCGDGPGPDLWARLLAGPTLV